MDDENFPGPPVLGRTQEERDKESSLFDKLCALFYPYVEKIVRPLIEADISAMPPPDEACRQEVKKLVALASVATDGDKGEDVERKTKSALEHPGEDLKDMMKEVDKIADEPYPPELAEKEVKETSAESNRILVSTWLQYLLRSCSDCSPFPLDPKTLDDAMFLLPGDEFYRDWPWPMDNQSAKEILRQVRRDLPEGKYLPDEAVEWIRQAGGTVVQ